MRSRCYGRACRRGWRRGSTGAGVVVTARAFSALSCTCMLALSAASVSSNNWRRSAFIASVRAANFHALGT